jgi:dCMP deaminase
MDPDFERAMGCMPKCGCGCGWPCPDAVAPGSSYDTGPGSCVAVHAEINALLDVADKNRLIGSTMYVNAAPCEGCLKILKNTAIVRIVWPEGEWVR